MKLPALIVKGRFGFIAVLVSFLLGLSFLTRLGLLIYSWPAADKSVNILLQTFGRGLFFDLVMCSYFIVPFVLHIWWSNEWIYKPNRRWWIAALGAVVSAVFLFVPFPLLIAKEIPKALGGYFLLRTLIYLWLSYRSPEFRGRYRNNVLLFDFFVVAFLMVFNACSKFTFWQEFSSRYNFIAVDYLVYTTEVVNNIKESYPLGWIIAGVLATSLSCFLVARKYIRMSLHAHMPFPKRSVVAISLLALPFLAWLGVTDKAKTFSPNKENNELAGNGVYDFGAAFINNNLDYFRFYDTIPQAEALSIVRNAIADSSVHFEDAFSLKRMVHNDAPAKPYNVVLISVESFSASFMKAFGNEENITPFLDSLSNESLFFTRLYAQGTRTVFGLEALSAAIAPTPGQSIVKRTDNDSLYTIGSILKKQNYTTQYVYGGNAYFDNMEDYFGGNGYQVIDRKFIDESKVHYANAWGVCDEDAFDLAMEKLNENNAKGQPFFTHIMTVSNHRPFTYPEGRIDISPKEQRLQGGVKYTDYSIRRFIQQARQKPWFNNTIFVITADHCYKSAGKTQLPVTGYHIPLMIYAPGLVKPKKVDRLMAQIDIAPTVLGLMGVSYESQFFGRDILQTSQKDDRLFVRTYVDLGYYHNGILTILSPKKRPQQFIPDFETGGLKAVPVNETLNREAIAFFQTASWLLKQKQYR